MGYVEPKMDSGKEWKPNKQEKDPSKNLSMDPIKEPAKEIIHPVVGDHLKMMEDPNLPKGPGKEGRKTIIILSEIT